MKKSEQTCARRTDVVVVVVYYLTTTATTSTTFVTQRINSKEAMGLHLTRFYCKRSEGKRTAPNLRLAQSQILL